MERGEQERSLRLMARYFERNSRRHSYAYELYGHLLLKNERYFLAVKILEQGQKEYPDSANIAQNSAVAYSRTKQPAKAGHAFWRAYQLGEAENDNLAFSAAYFFSRAGKYNRAGKIVKNLISQKGYYPQWVQLYAQCLIKSGKGKKAIPLLESAVKVNRENSKLWRILGWLYSKHKGLEKAAAAYRIAAKLDPENTRIELGKLFLNLGAINQGDHLLRKESPKIMDYMAFFYARYGDLEAALAKAKRVYNKAPTDKRLFRIAHILYRMNRFQEAEKYYRKLVKKKGRLSTKAKWAMAVMSWQQGDWNKACHRFRAIAHSDSKLNKQAGRLLPILERITG
ncbi:MAG: hypothetical protein CSA26_13090, partial [Desulfobacterales bacterium]